MKIAPLATFRLYLNMPGLVFWVGFFFVSKVTSIRSVCGSLGRVSGVAMMEWINVTLGGKRLPFPHHDLVDSVAPKDFLRLWAEFLL